MHWISLTAHGSPTSSPDHHHHSERPDETGIRVFTKCAKEEPQGRRTGVEKQQQAANAGKL